ncbi:invasion associated locus B family protein [Alphaproteobacteria bacterium]|nr:invasion associated locus B family protein [Alphaproteobacteria bacterium]
MKNFKKIILLPFVLLTFFISSAVTAETKLLGSKKYWKAYSTKVKNSKTCFITSEPIKTTGKFNKENRGKPYVFVTNTKGGNNHEVSIKAGFNFKRNYDVIFNVDGNKTKLFPVDDRAWSESSKTDRYLVQSMRKGKKLKITGTSSPGNKVIDIYSLLGFTKALSLIDKSCL